MNWLFFALLAPAIYSVINFIDKYILEKEIKDYTCIPIFSGIIAFIFGTILWFVTGFPILSFTDAFLILLTGVLTLLWAYFYFIALSDETVSSLTVLFQTTPLFVLILSFFILGEVITFRQTLGFLLIIISAIGVSYEKQKNKFKLSKAFYLMLIANLMLAVAAVLFKFVVEGSSFSKIISYESWGMGVGALLLYIGVPSVKKAFHKSLKKVRKIALLAIFINEAVYVAARGLTYFAFSLGPVSIISAIGGIQVFFGIIYGYILTLIAPSIFKENVSRQGLIKKISFATLAFFGIWLVS